jgi:hypothetical protein
MQDAYYADDVDPKHLLGDAAYAVDAFFRYMERYRSRHGYNPDIVAVCHKGGCGTAKTVFKAWSKGLDIDRAILAASEKHKVPRTPEYVRRFRIAFEKYQ